MRYLILIAGLIFMVSCHNNNNNKPVMLEPAKFTTVLDEKNITLYTLESGNGIFMQVTNFGARVVSLFVQNSKGVYNDVVLGYDNINDYINNKGERFLGPVVGRFANRIANGQFIIDTTTYTLPVNNNGQTLHGGLHGLDMVVWDVDKISKNEICFSYISADGDEGFPGQLTIEMCYLLTPDNEFKITYRATTNKTTVVNLSHHGIYNLKGMGNGTITDNILTINASYFTPVNNLLIPFGNYEKVEGTPFDFRKPTQIGKRIGQNNQQLINGSGYDHNWVIDTVYTGIVKHVATLHDPVSNLAMDILTDQPGLQFYSGNFFDGKTKGKYGKTMDYRQGVALETQKFPDSPNCPNFPSTLLNPGQVYAHTCIYRFYNK